MLKIEIWLLGSALSLSLSLSNVEDILLVANQYIISSLFNKAVVCLKSADLIVSLLLVSF